MSTEQHQMMLFWRSKDRSSRSRFSCL